MAAAKSTDDLYDQIERLRGQLDSLVQRAGPAMAGAMHQASDAAHEQIDALSGRVRSQPIVAVLIAAAAGYLLGRISR